MFERWVNGLYADTGLDLWDLPLRVSEQTENAYLQIGSQGG